MIDWQQNEQILIQASDAALRVFLSEHPVDTICAVGYVFELWNSSEQFDLVANTHSFFRSSLRTSIEKWPELTNEDEIRWNSGDFEFPAGLPSESYRDTWRPWRARSIQLHKLAAGKPTSNEVYDGLIAICCAAIAELAKRGLFGNWTNIDFNVCEVGDDIRTIKERDQQIRKLITNHA